jgi:hypothetical protein
MAVRGQRWDLRDDGRIILKWILNKSVEEWEVDSSGSGSGQMTGLFKCGGEHLVP